VSGYHVVPMPSRVAAEARTTMLAPQYGHPAHAAMATDWAPCRVCLRMIRPGKERWLLFTYDPFESAGAPPLPGPVYIHAQPCEPYDGPGFPPQLRQMSILLDVYGDQRRLLAEELLGEVPDEAAIDAAVVRHLANDDARYIHVRSASAGCFAATITHRGARGVSWE
jgi:hypothetical protein